MKNLKVYYRSMKLVNIMNELDKHLSDEMKQQILYD